MTPQNDLINIGQTSLRNAITALTATMATLGDSFTRAVEMILHCRGKVILTGMGKSGHVARKIAATLTSTGTPAIFLHAAEAAHGDLGIIRA
jgi:arabinose-5-phosphate isomerase